MKIKIIILLAFFLSCSGSLLAETKVFYSPNGGILKEVLKNVNESKHSIDLMIFHITYKRIANALIKAKEKGVSIRLIVDESQSLEENSMAVFLKNSGIKIKSLAGQKGGLMHNKVAIFDNKTVMTGSYNWTYSAEKFNYENAVFIDDPQVIQSYKKEFNKLWVEINIPKPHIKKIWR
ncbi:MAG: phospholipase D-like domain-containing protein [Elusimicrobia bacterium]|nr:phospholipase D-like domain-containing protein [Candidatus Liberimonas magnetica]